MKKAVKKLTSTTSKKEKKRIIRKTQKNPQHSNPRFQKIKEAIEKEKKMKSFQNFKRLERVENFIGVFPSDQLPVITSSPAFLVVNIDSSCCDFLTWRFLREMRIFLNDKIFFFLQYIHWRPLLTVGLQKIVTRYICDPDPFNGFFFQTMFFHDISN